MRMIIKGVQEPISPWRGRPHHNNKGLRQIREGKCELEVRRIARKLGIRYKAKTHRERGGRTLVLTSFGPNGTGLFYNGGSPHPTTSRLAPPSPTAGGHHGC
jgi:hypothetical protein